MNEKMRDGLVKRGATWSYVIRVKDPETGRSKPRWIGGFPSRAAAKAARDAARNASNRGTWVPPQDMTLAAWLDRWITSHEVELKPSTAAGYRQNITRYLVPALGHERLQQLSPSRLSVVFREMHERGGMNGRPLSPRTVEYARAVLRRALQDAVLDRVIEVNPVFGTKRPKAIKPTHTTWTGAQVSAFLGHLAERDQRFAELWHLALATGMRRGELLALRWSDVDLEAGTVSVERSVFAPGAERTYTTPKNHERRTVGIDARTLAVLKEHRKAQAEARLAAGPLWADAEGLLFVWSDGSPLHPGFVTKEFGRAQLGSGLPRLILHEARHTHATVLLRAGVPVHIVAKRLGHRDPTVTLSVYADVIPDDDDRAVETFSKAVFGA